MWSCKHSPAIRPAQGPFSATGYKRNRKPGKGKGSRKRKKINSAARQYSFGSWLRDPAIPRGKGKRAPEVGTSRVGPIPSQIPPGFPRPSTLILSWRRIRVFGLTYANFLFVAGQLLTLQNLSTAPCFGSTPDAQRRRQICRQQSLISLFKLLAGRSAEMSPEA